MLNNITAARKMFIPGIINSLIIVLICLPLSCNYAFTPGWIFLSSFLCVSMPRIMPLMKNFFSGESDIKTCINFLSSGLTIITFFSLSGILISPFLYLISFQPLCISNLLLHTYCMYISHL